MQLYRLRVWPGLLALSLVAAGCGKKVADDSPGMPAATSASSEAPSPSGPQNSIIVHVTRKSKRYHLEGCPRLKKSDFAMDLQTAKSRGLTPCHVCNPP